MQRHTHDHDGFGHDSMQSHHNHVRGSEVITPSEQMLNFKKDSPSWVHFHGSRHLSKKELAFPTALYRYLPSITFEALTLAAI